MKKNHFLLILGTVFSTAVMAQTSHDDARKEVKGWHQMDKQADGYFGISLAKAYELIKTKNLKKTSEVSIKRILIFPCQNKKFYFHTTMRIKPIESMLTKSK